MPLWHGMLTTFGGGGGGINVPISQPRLLVLPIRVARECSASAAAHGPRLPAEPLNRHLRLWSHVFLQRLNIA